MSILAARDEGWIRLNDRRLLGYAEYGVASGRPILWFHGSPGARGQLAPEARALAVARDIRLVVIERPGVGSSTPHLYDHLVEWAHDIAQFADARGIDRFATIGLSGGGPYSLACAHEMPERVIAAVTLGGVAPSVGEEAPAEGIVGRLPRAAPALSRAWRPLGRGLGRLCQALEPFADPVMDLYLRTLPPGDRAVFDDIDTRRAFQRDIVVASETGMYAFFLDLILFGRPWGFSLRKIRVPVRLWQGDADPIIPYEHGEHMAALIPDAQLRMRPGEGHLGGLGATAEVFEVLLEEWG
ncbi:MAG: alpha/beta hydrolase [Deltaproteobacteria bacterium]|nr:MAG: alpha/beta hydrolase [Deltaproteobacteria bacterium]UCF47103.1 MAG: alpha/beta hydrolase [Myxococcales bacterium]